MKRSAIGMSLLLTLIVSGLLASCASNPKKALVQQTGIVPCMEAVVKPLKSERDVSRFELSAKLAKCKPDLSTSIIQASMGECRGLIDLRGSCSYSFGRRTVIAERILAAGDVSRYEVRSW